MRTPMRSSRAAFVCVALVASAGGCQTFEPSTPLTVLVRDAETHAPVPGATVRLWRYGSHSEEHDQQFTTGADGTATPHVAPPDEGGVMVEVNAPGYLSASTTLPHDVTDALATAKRFHPYKGPPLSITVDTFAGPRPTAELIIPSSYRGIVKAEIRARADGSWPAGQRTFTYTLPVYGSNGVIRLDGPMVFKESVGPDIVAKFTDGSTIPTTGKNADVAFRWVRRNGDDVYFVVGTSVDAEDARRKLGANDIDQSPPKKTGGGGGGGGGGRGGGRGGRGGGMGGGGMGGGGMGSSY